MYSQIELDIPCRDNVSFNTPFARFRYKRLPIGITSARELYQRVFGDIFAGRDGLENTADDFLVHGNHSDLSNIKFSSKFDTYSAVSEQEISKRVLKENSKSCRLNPISTKILKQNLPSILPVLTKIAHQSLAERTFPTCIKNAVVTPLPKKKL